jgi:flagellar assembly factor FliW
MAKSKAVAKKAVAKKAVAKTAVAKKAVAKKAVAKKAVAKKAVAKKAVAKKAVAKKAVAKKAVAKKAVAKKAVAKKAVAKKAVAKKAVAKKAVAKKAVAKKAVAKKAVAKKAVAKKAVAKKAVAKKAVAKKAVAKKVGKSITIRTTNFGKLTVTSEMIFHFPKGLLHFKDMKRFVVLADEGQEPLKYLQSVEFGDICFTVVDPKVIDLSYPSTEDGVENGSVVQFVMMGFADDNEELPTVNMREPIILDVPNYTGKQVSLGTEFSLQFHLTDGSQEVEEKRGIRYHVYRFGEIEIHDDNVFTFPKGIPGFEDLRKFIVISEEGMEPIKWFVSLENPAIGFPVTHPHYLDFNYPLTVDGNDTSLFVILNITKKAITANMRRPVRFDMSTQTGEQMHLSAQEYPALDFETPVQLADGFRVKYDKKGNLMGVEISKFISMK